MLPKAQSDDLNDKANGEKNIRMGIRFGRDVILGPKKRRIERVG